MTLRSTWRPGDRFLVRHKDKALIVVEKKAGVLSQATESGRGEDMLHLLRDFIGARGASTGIFPVHRLDRTVSGLLVYARRADVQADLIGQFARHDVKRRYIAGVHGLLDADEGTFESDLWTKDPSLRVYSVDDGRPGARTAITHWRVIERLPRADVTLVEVELETGLRNQIRVHFSEAGHPLLGEKKYVELEEGAPARQGAERIFLHAAVLGFVHPITGEELLFEAPLPPDLRGWLGRLSRGPGGPRDRSAARPTSERAAPERAIPERRAPERAAPEHRAPERAAPTRPAPERAAPERTAPTQAEPRRKKAHRGQAPRQRRRKKR